MANDIIGSMFGVDPNQIAMQNLQRAYQQNAQMASQDPLSGGLMANVGSNIGMLGARAMGLKTREEQVAENRQQIAAMIKDESPESYMAAAQKAQELGDTQAATMLVQKANEAKITQSKLAYEAAQTKKIKDAPLKVEWLPHPTDPNLEIMGQWSPEDQTYVPLEGERGRTRSRTGGGGGSDRAIMVTDAEGNVTAFDPSGTKVRARFPGAGKPTATFEKETNKLPIMEQGLQSIDDALSYVNKGIYTGSYANIQKNAAKLNPLASKEKAENTEAFLASIGNVVIPRLQEFGGSDSNEELKYLQRVTAGEITLEEGSIKKIMNDARTKMNKEIARRKAGKEPTYPGAGGNIAESYQAKPKVYDPVSKSWK